MHRGVGGIMGNFRGCFFFENIILRFYETIRFFFLIFGKRIMHSSGILQKISMYNNINHKKKRKAQAELGKSNTMGIGGIMGH